VPRNPLFRRLVVGAALLALVSVAPASAQYYTSFGKNKIQYRDFDWQIYHSPHFDVFFYASEEGLLEKVVSHAESAYDRLSREFDHQIQDPIPLIFYATHSAFEQNNIIFNFIPEGIGAFASPVRNRMVLPVDLPDSELFQLVMHELTHVFQYDAILQGKLGRITGSAPQWVTEGMASYMAKDETPTEKMFLRDAVVNDTVPSILQRGVSGYMAYRFGHAAFDYIEDRWGKEGFRDFIYEFRNTLGGRPEKAIERALRIDAEDFDLDFRRWLRQKYLPELVATGEPSDFGRPFRDPDGEIGVVTSPTASPSGDLVAAMAVSKGDLDVLLFDTKNRRVIANLTRGYSADYQYLVAQHIISGARGGRDLAFSPDGNRLAFFAKRERGRSLVLLDVLARKVERVVDMEVEQQLGPAFSADGRKVAFAANHDGDFDVFVYDIDSGEVSNLTDDDVYNISPVYSPDGKTLVYSAAVGDGHLQLFELDLADPTSRRQLTSGAWDDRGAVFSTDGGTIYFTSNRTGADNIWALELATGKTRQYTNAVTGCLMPTVLHSADGADRLVYAGFWRGSFDLYLSDLGKPVGETTAEVPAPGSAVAAELPKFQTDIEVVIDPASQEKKPNSRLFLEDAGGSVGITSDQYVLGQVYLSFTDYLGDKRMLATLSSVDTFSNFDFVYLDVSRRWNWSLRLFDDRTFYLFDSPTTGERVRSQAVYRRTGVLASYIYPISYYYRFSVGTGFIWRQYDYAQLFLDINGDPVFDIAPISDNYPIVTASVTGDTTVASAYGPVSGHRWQLTGNYGWDLDGGGALTSGFDLDFRQYFEVTRRSSFAIRAFAGYADGSLPAIYPIGGLDTVRGIGYQALSGDRAFFTNLEFRFPLVDQLRTPILNFQGIRGRVFLDVGGAWRDYLGEDFKFWNSDENRLEDAISSYGWGFTVRFIGLDLNWDFAKLWDFKQTIDGGFSTNFWIGTRF